MQGYHMLVARADPGNVESVENPLRGRFTTLTTLSYCDVENVENLSWGRFTTLTTS